MGKTLVFENENIGRLNDCMVEYYNPETEESTYKLSIEVNPKNRDLWEYLIDFGCAGNLEKQITKILEYNTKGYCRWRKKNSDGHWTKECEKFDGTKEVVKYYVTEVKPAGEVQILVTENKIEAIKAAGERWNSLSVFERKTSTIEIRIYDEDIDAEDCTCFDYDTIPWRADI